jgi:beta-lactamase regulating signal transducer with metallopeptidase domain
MNTDISGEHIEGFEIDTSTKNYIIIFLVVVIVGITIYFLKFRECYTTTINQNEPGLFSKITSKFGFEKKSEDNTIIMPPTTTMTGGKRKLKKNKISSNEDNSLITILMIGGIIILSYMLYRLYTELRMLKELEKKNNDKNKMTDNRDTIKIATPELVGSMNAGQYTTTRYGYFISNP